MAKIAKNLTELIGRTPLMELAEYSRKYGLKQNIIAKLEAFNPAGSVKDRVALAMIEDAEARGALKPGATIIEPTSGNTGVGLAMVATIKGYHLMLTMPETMSIERRNLLKALGAEIVLTDGLTGMAGSIAKTQELEVGTVGLATAYTTEGQLLGHISMGMAMINNAAKKLNIPRETAMLLEHIMLSHHGVPEYGSPQMPMFPEAEIVSAIDTLDARLFEMFDALSAVNTGEFTDRQWALDNRRLYRHGHKFSKESGGFQSGAGTTDGQPAAAAEDDSLAAKLSSLAGKFNSIKS